MVSDRRNQPGTSMIWNSSRGGVFPVCWTSEFPYFLVSDCCMAMQNLVNAVKGTALGVAEYLTPVLKVFLREDLC